MAVLAAEAGIPVLAPVRPREPDFLAALAALEPDCCPVVAYGALVPRAALDIPRHGWVNLHFSLLPAWRGAAPVQAAVLHGDEVTGASTFQIEEGLDTGPVYGVVTEPVRPRDTAGDLLDRLSRSGAELLVRTVDGIEDGTVVAVPQRADGVSMAPKVDGRGRGGGLVGAGGPGRPAGPGVHAGARGVDHVRAGPAQARPGAAGAGRAGARAGGAAGREAAGAGRHRDPPGRAGRGAGAGQAADAGARLGPRRPSRPPASPPRRPRTAARPAGVADAVPGSGVTGRPPARRRGGPAGRRPGPTRPAPRREADPARRVAYDLLRAVDERDAYANLTLPALLRERGLTGRDAAFATELGYGTLRAAGALDEFLARCADRPVEAMDPAARAALRLGAYQLLRTRVPPHAAVSATVDLAPRRAAGFVNAVLRRLARQDWDAWVAEVAPPDELGRLALRHAHPRWIAAAFADALGGDLAETEAALAADDARPQTHLVARPGRVDRDRLAAQAGGEPGPWSPYAVRLPSGGDPGALAAVRDGRAGVQDEGSQLCALALTRVPLDGPDARWLDLCAGPGGKAALLGSLAALRARARREAAAARPHPATGRDGAPDGTGPAATGARPARARGPRWERGWWRWRWPRIGLGWWRRRPRDCRWTWCARTGPSPPWRPGWADRVLVDAPCTGLGALRRRPEARWRRSEDDLAELTRIQRALLRRGIEAARPGGVVAYVVCSPHLAETRDVVDEVLADGTADLLDAAPYFPADGPTVQLWPHRHGTDAMFCALLRRRADRPGPSIGWPRCSPGSPRASCRRTSPGSPRPRPPCRTRTGCTST